MPNKNSHCLAGTWKYMQMKGTSVISSLTPTPTTMGPLSSSDMVYNQEIALMPSCPLHKQVLSSNSSLSLSPVCHNCLDFFDTKEIEEDNQVCHLLVEIKDHRIQDWISGQHDYIVKLSFTAFLKEICSKYLLLDWEPKVHIHILSANFNHRKQTFWNFASYLQKQNFQIIYEAVWQYKTMM